MEGVKEGGEGSKGGELDDECKGVSRANYLEFVVIQAVVAGRLTE